MSPIVLSIPAILLQASMVCAMNAAWRYCGEAPQRAVHRSTSELCDGTEPPIEHNDGLWLSPPQKVKTSDPATLKVVRTPFEARPLTLNNSDNKAECGLTSLGMSPALQQFGHASQKGFIRGRQLLDNPVILDWQSRILAFRCAADRPAAAFCDLLPLHSVQNLAVTALLDYAHAFASVKHDWIRQVCEAIHVPIGIRTFIDSWYRNCNAYIHMDGSICPLGQLNSGVLQCCPLS